MGLTAGCQTTGLVMPKGASAPAPAVLLIYGTGGSGGRYEYYGPALQEEGFAVYYAEYWTPNEKSPFRGSDAWIGDAFNTLKELRKNPAIDGNRIAIMGFSRGGRIALHAAEDDNKAEHIGAAAGFAAHVAFYPACGGAGLVTPTGAPILILAGDEDELSDEKTWCPILVKSLRGSTVAELKIYKGAGHAFDADFSNYTWYGTAADDARKRAVAFLKRYLKSN